MSYALKGVRVIGELARTLATIFSTTIFSTTIFNLLARTLATILYTPPTKVIGQNSLISLAPGFFVIREIKVALRLFFKRTSSVKFMEGIILILHCSLI
jgi:hypothetical protein